MKHLNQYIKIRKNNRKFDVDVGMPKEDFILYIKSLQFKWLYTWHDFKPGLNQYKELLGIEYNAYELKNGNTQQKYCVKFDNKDRLNKIIKADSDKPTRYNHNTAMNINDFIIEIEK